MWEESYSSHASFSTSSNSLLDIENMFDLLMCWYWVCSVKQFTSDDSNSFSEKLIEMQIGEKGDSFSQPTEKKGGTSFEWNDALTFN